MPRQLSQVYDKCSKYLFLVDTGATVSIIPPNKSTVRSTQPQASLRAANVTKIQVYGQVSLTIDIGLRREYRWLLLVADIGQPILGADFLSHFNLLIDMGKKTIKDGTTTLDKNCRVVNAINFAITTEIPDNIPNCYQEMLNKFLDLCNIWRFKEPQKHGIVHHIPTNGAPIYCKARRLPPDRHNIAKVEFEHML
jgi:hypothetical protein